MADRGVTNGPGRAVRPARVLMAWELGGNLGHVVPLLAIARRLRERGHQVCFAMRSLTHAGLLAREGFSFLPAPGAPVAPKPRTYRCYAQMLSGEVFPTFNAALVGALAWRTIFQATGPDAIVADHAPLALLAARGTTLHTAIFGIPFSIPVAGEPLPRFFSAGAEEAGREEALLCERMNRVLVALKGPKLDAASDLYRVDATMVESFPEMDCFGPRPPEHYVGPLLAEMGDATPAWPEATGPRLLVYIRPGHWVLPLMQALVACKASALVYIAGANRGNLPAGSDGICLSEQPLKLSALFPQCDGVVCHGGNGVVAAALASGKPLLLLPNYVEHRLTAERVARLGVGRVAADPPDSRSLAQFCEGLRGSMSEAAARFASRPGVRPAEGGLDLVSGRIDQLLAQGRQSQD